MSKCVETCAPAFVRGNLCLFCCLFDMTLYSRYFHLQSLPEPRTKIIENKERTFPLFSLPNPSATFFGSGGEFLTILSISKFTFLSHLVFPFHFGATVRSLAGLCQNIIFFQLLFCFSNLTECSFVPVNLAVS